MRTLLRMLFMTLLFLPCVIVAQENKKNGSRIRVYQPMVVDNKIQVSYDLRKRFYQQANITLWVSFDGGKTFEGPMKSVTGDVWPVLHSGKKKRSCGMPWPRNHFLKTA